MLPTFPQYPEESSSNSGPRSAPALPGKSTALPSRPMRKQVSRACDWCRARRIKCDNGKPCRACRVRDVQCTHKGTDEPRTLPQALREIDGLKARVKELEDELSTYKTTLPRKGSIPSPPTSCSPTSSKLRHSSSQKDSPPLSATKTSTTGPRPQWEGIFVATARSDQTSYWGPGSAYYYISRIGAYLGKALHKTCENRSLLPVGASRKIASMTEPVEGLESLSIPAGSSLQGPSMTRTQEEYFLGLFWQGYHCVLPIVDEVDFRRHYSSLWELGRPARRNSPLVDIVIALCVQYGYTFIPKERTNSATDMDYDDATIAGRWYYRRCQSLLVSELESPSITTVQCQIFSIVYLCCASFQNMTHIAMATTIRSAQIVGLHLEPPMDMPRGERELRKRIWAVIYTIEVKSSMKLGRPISVDPAQVSVTAPSDSVEAASLNGAALGSYDRDVTWLTYTVHMKKLVDVTREIHTALYAKCGEMISHGGNKNLYKDAQGLEACAELLATKLPALRAWLDNLPDGMKIKRRNGGESFSIDRSPMEADPLVPVWLQRQRICLELMYHSMNTNLCRPFVVFHSTSGTYTPITERHATACVNHAIAHTRIMHQAISEMDVLSGWTEFFLWQWNAAVTIIGFILAYPVHPVTPHARRALEKAIAIFDIFGANFAVSASAASIARDLIGKADFLSDRLRTGITPGLNKAVEVPKETGTEVVDDDLSWLDPSQQDDSEFMDWALSVDAFNSFDKFFDANHGTDPWMFGQL